MAGPPHTLHIVSGKGGTGKTTVAGALACALATRGRRVLLCEVEGRNGLAELFESTPLAGTEERRLRRTPDGGQVFGLAVDAEDALMEYLDTFYHLGLAGRALDRVGAVDFATSIAPGLRDVLLTGKVYEAVRRQTKKLPNAYDAVVLDAPPTGRIAQFLNVHEAVAGLARMGPIRSQADSIMRVLRSSQTIVHLVTLLEDMPVTETEEAIKDLRPTQIRVGSVIANMVTPTPLTGDQLALAVKGQLELSVPGFSARENAALAAEFSTVASRIQLERECHESLAGLGLPLVEVTYDAAGIDEGALFGIADQLAAQLPAEVAR
ncbi:ArsA-related P-loop ATPase [Microlunatus panaciterrae]|uniref:Anion-transporting ArsA/GET3 family ATPase n=1 Tax=Microlunatus panaciterrae TaxID=400768 RepID=A0ABS2RJM3_9ACTN|nr:ArsA-related P-loop ATPase [Microlunatus panaciterrae]MBM7799191.1 anion-transporting ArsA/GET3 family ATPase [Microlunatus panaciterrae]